MGQFKPMVKMMTTEPTVELKLKKGGKVEKKMQMGGVPAMAPAMGGLPARGGDMAAAAPARPDMMRRRRMMKAMGAGPAAPVGSASRMMKEGGESSSEHKAEMKKMSGTAAELKEHKSMPASKGHKGLKNGGVPMGQGGFKKGGNVAKYASGGIIKSPMFKTKVNTATPDHSPATTGGVKNGNGGGYKSGGVAKFAKGGGVEGNVSTSSAGVSNTTTGEVRKGNAGGFKKGGATKKFARGGSVNDSGKAEAMPQGHKKPSAPVSITALSGTFKKGGKVKKMAEGGDAQQKENAEGYKNWEKDERKFNEGLRSDVESAMTYPLRKGKELFDKVKGSKFVKEAGEFADEYGDLYMKGLGLRSQNAPGPRAITKTKESVTVQKKRGGGAC